MAQTDEQNSSNPVNTDEVNFEAVTPGDTPTAAPPKSANTTGPEDSHTLEHILRLSVPLIVKVAQKRMKMQEILKMNLGTIIQFEKDAYDHIDLMVNNSTIGLGQPIKIGENFGLRIVQIGDLEQTIKSLAGK